MRVTAERYLSLQEVGDELGVSDQTVRRWVKAGELAAYKPGKEYRIKGSDLEEFLQTREVGPKGQAPLPLENGPAGPSDAERRLSHWWVDALENYIEARIEKYGAEVQDPQSPHFRTATAATLWVAQVEEEAAMWSDWVRKQPLPLFPSARGEGWRQLLDFEVLSMILTIIGEYPHVADHGKLRIEAMNDKPDELATRRLEKATADAERSRERLKEWRRSAGG